jgi:hypothetical protein
MYPTIFTLGTASKSNTQEILNNVFYPFWLGLQTSEPIRAVVLVSW